MSFATGSLVTARGRDWVVLPESDDELLVLRPLGGTDDEVTGILRTLEEVKPAHFDLPDPSASGVHRSARLLRDALRLGFRSSAGPFRCFGKIAVEPRPYQLVPLLMALRQDPVRLLVADDVGVGKTIEAGLVARELIEQGDATGLAVLCPPQLAEQWQAELADKFHVDAVLVLASTAARLERNLPVGRTIFTEHPFVIVSTDFIKADRRRDDFIRTCPDLVIVDEAHTCAADLGTRNRGRHQRHELVTRLAADPQRHLVLVTATPHSGKEGAFRSLVSLLDPPFADLPDDLSGEQNRRHRERLAQYLVQRRRDEIHEFGGHTSFPERFVTEETYRLSPEYRRLFDRVLAYAQELVRDPHGGRRRQRVRWWSALALLRALASSPKAAAETLNNRSPGLEAATAEEVDQLGRQTVMDIETDDNEPSDVVAGADSTSGDDDVEEQDGPGSAGSERARLLRLAREVAALAGDGDQKLLRGAEIVRQLVAASRRPIVFCRFIATADYLAEELRRRLPKRTEVAAVTGALTPTEREHRIADLASHERRVLVSTDCLSEGVNLQEQFDAVVHYDLPWNPTRLEQREGRVDRFNQPRPDVRIVTYYGEDNGIDRVVLDVLLRKHRQIHKALGVSIPVPGNSDEVIEAVAEGLLQAEGPVEERLPGMDEWLTPRTEKLLADWDRAADREHRSRRLFAQQGIQVGEVMPEVLETRAAIGSDADVEALVRTAVPAYHGRVLDDRTVADRRDGSDGAVAIDLSETPLALRDALGGVDTIQGRFRQPVDENEDYLSRTHPAVAALASFVLDGALDRLVASPARRCGVIRTAAVTTRTTLLLVRHRFQLVIRARGEDTPLLAEECAALAFEGAPTAPVWLPVDPKAVEPLFAAEPSGNVHPQQAREFLGDVVDAHAHWQPRLDEHARERAEVLRASHERVRVAARQKGVRVAVEPQVPADVLGIYVYLPGGPR